jgi:branched-chain amino acid transport system substrate-binding protein
VRNRTLTTITVVLTASAVALAGCSNSKKKTGGGGGGGLSSGAAASGGGGGAGKTYKIGFEGPLSGDNAQLGINEKNGAQLAVDQANASGKYKFKVQLLESDDGGDPAKSPAAATTLQQDPAVLGVVGPSFSGSTKAVGASYDAAGLVFITPSASNPSLSKLGFKLFHRIVPDDNVEGSQGADWLARKGVKNVFVIDDLSDYGTGVSNAVLTELKVKGVKTEHQGVDAKTTDYSGVATKVKSSGAGAVFYGGYDAQAALFAKALKAAGYTGLTVTGNGGKSSVFTSGAGSAGDGWYFTCGCQDATTAPAAKDFTAAYVKAFKTPPSTYSPEAFDAVNATIDAINTAAQAGEPTRATVVEAVNKLDFKGITTEIKFQSNGEVDASVQTVNLFQQKAGKITQLGNIKEQN